MTPTSRPPVRSTHSRRAMSSPSIRAFSMSFRLAFAGPITPTTNRTMDASCASCCRIVAGSLLCLSKPETWEVKRSKTGGRERDVAVSPGFFKPCRDIGGFRFFVLRLQTLDQTKKGPAVLGIPFQIDSILAFSFGCTTGHKQDRPKIVTGGERPQRRLRILQRLIYFNGFFHCLEGLVVPLTMSGDLAGEQTI